METEIRPRNTPAAAGRAGRKSSLAAWAAAARGLRELLSAEAGQPRWRATFAALEAAQARHAAPGEPADHVAQMLACATAAMRPFALRAAEGDGAAERSAIRWLLAAAEPWFRLPLRYAAVAWGLADDPADASPALLDQLQRLARGAALPATLHYDEFLQAYDPAVRRRRGVFFTPPPLARYLLRQADAALRANFQLPAGLADETRSTDGGPWVRLLDPAAGDGLFLREAAALIHRTLREAWRDAGLPMAEQQTRWNDYACTQILPRLAGLELLPAPCLLAQLRLALALVETGCRCEALAPLRIVLGNALAGPEATPLLAEPCTVLVGNPPFASLSANQQPWIERLVRGDAAAGVAGYLQCDGRPLAERKHWLHDDYVKFLRLAQWRIEASGGGLAALVANHGWLDNLTARGLRQQLLRTFSQVDVVDLHGNRKKGEQSPSGERDENVFGIESGVSLAVLVQPVAPAPPRIRYAELWGARDRKLAALESGEPLPFRSLEPSAAPYLLVPAPSELPCPAYAAAIRLPDAMPVNTTAPVTARDGFAVAFTAEELAERVEQFCDLSVSDDEIRRRWFLGTRSSRHLPGDTRGWKLPAARRALAAVDWRTCIRPCWYRPFDRRWVLWHPRIVDWPRTEICRHLLEGNNLALVARRQMLPGRACTFFWVVDGLALDGVIRSDSRGSESLFPLWLDEGASRRGNFTDECRARLAAAGEASPRALLEYAYAIFHSPGYRERNAAALRRDFPRLPAPRSAELFQALASLGAQLCQLHLLQSDDPLPADLVDASPAEIGQRVPETARLFRAGGHQVLRKWLADRRGRPLTAAEEQTYRRIAAAILETLAIMERIEACIAEQGGWPGAFHT